MFKIKKWVQSLIFLLLFISCDKEHEYTGRLLADNFSFSECKNEKSAIVYDSESVEYRYAEGDNLYMKYKNVYFNCCQPKNNLQVEITYSGDSVIVNEYEKKPGLCDCICPYDVECCIGPLQEKEYWIIVKIAEIESFRFLINFNEGLEGVKNI